MLALILALVLASLVKTRPKANLRNSLQMAYLLQLYRQEDSLKCRLRNKLFNR